MADADMDRRLNVFVNNCATDGYNFGDDSSSDEEAKSSDDDIDNVLNRHQESDSDSFEKEMEMELNKEFMEHRKRYWKPPTAEQDPSKDKGSQDDPTDNKYDDAYFSSGSEDEDNVGGVSSKSKQRRTVQTDDELLYDPNMDEENENWVTEQRKGYQNKETENKLEDDVPVDESEPQTTKPKTATKQSTNTKSDAILSCPACLATLCIDCQRHDVYKQQFRAMFVMNCNIIPDETLRYEAKKDKKKSGKKKQSQQQDDSSSVEVSDELFNPVQCALCNTEVAVYDKEEIYHFFNVVESLS